MGIRRGSFESTNPTTAVAKPSLSSSKRSTFRPDIGRNLRTGALALDAWSDAFGKMAETAKAMKGKLNANQQAVYRTAKDKDAAVAAYENYLNGVKFHDITPDFDTEKRLKDAADAMTRRAEVAKGLGLFSNNFDYNKRY